MIAEQFIENDHPDVIEAEIFVSAGKVTVWGIMDSVRDPYTNPLLPAAYSYPSKLPEKRFDLVKSEISRLIECANVRYGAFNIEMLIDAQDHLYFLDVGPRNGGNMLPKYIGMIMNGDLEMETVCAAMGDYDRFEDQKLDGKSGGYWGLCVLHASKNGVFKGMEYDPAIRPFLLNEVFFVNCGERVNRFAVARDAIGLAFFRFPSAEIRNAVLGDFRGKYLRPVLT